MSQASGASDLSFYSAVDSPAGLPQAWSRTPVPRLCLAQEGPFLSELPQSEVRGFGRGCAFRNTTYRPSDFAQPSEEYGLLLHHPQFLEWIGAPESAHLLDKGPGAWMHSLSREQAIDAARQLHRDMCLMTSNLNVLDKYVLSLQGTATNILDLSLGARYFPSAEVAAEARIPQVRRTAVHMEASTRLVAHRLIPGCSLLDCSCYVYFVPGHKWKLRRYYVCHTIIIILCAFRD